MCRQGIQREEPVEIVIRPEDLEITTLNRGSSRYALIPNYSAVFIMKFAVMTKMEMNGLSIQQKRQMSVMKSGFILTQKRFMSCALVKRRKNLKALEAYGVDDHGK